MISDFTIISQQWTGKDISFEVTFLINEKCTKNDFDMLFINDIACSKITFPVQAEFSKSKVKTLHKVTAKVINYAFDPQLNYDQLTNFSVFRIVNPKLKLEINIPTYCGSEDSKSIVVEIYNPI